MSEKPAGYTSARLRAMKAQNAKRRGNTKAIPQIRLTDEEAAQVGIIFKRYGGTKKQAVLDGLRLLDRKLKQKNSE